MRRVFYLVVVLVAALSGAAPVYAQGPRGDRAVFGGGVGNMEQVVSVSSNLGASFYQALGQRPDLPIESVSSTFATQASGQIGYSVSRQYLRAQAGAGIYRSYYREPTPTWFGQHFFDGAASAARTWQVSSRSSLMLSQLFAVRPTFMATLADSQMFPAGDSSLNLPQLLPPDATNFDGHSLWATSSAGSNSLSRRVSTYTTYLLEQRWDVGRPDAIDLFSQTLTAGLSFAVTRHLSVHGGYRASDTRNGPPGSPHVRTQGADVGIDYNRGGAIRLSRKTLMTFGIGVQGAIDSGGGQHYFLVGNLGLNHEIGRTWRTSVGYDRSLNFSSLFIEPTLSDNVRADLVGLIARRVSSQSGIAFSRGTVGFVAAGHGIRSTTIFTDLHLAMTRYVALGTSYSYYYRSIENLVVVPEGLDRQARGQTFRVFATAWAPLFYRARRPNATR